MKTLINIIARVLLAAAIFFLLYAGIPSIIASVTALNEAGTWGQFMDATARDLHITLLLQGLTCLGALIALVGIFTGRRSVLLFITAVILMIYPVYRVIVDAQAGVITGDWNTSIWPLIKTYAGPICYFLGFLFLVNIRDERK